MRLSSRDREYMTLALRLAAKGRGSTSPNPMVGALVVTRGRIVGQGSHRKAGGPHAEVIALSQAGSRAKGGTLYVTLEPCLMCAGALVNARIGRIVYGAIDPKAGAVESLYQVCADERLNHRLPTLSGVSGDECSKLLKDFFAARRD